MKIALIAPSGAGKTAYLTGLYGVLTQDLSHSRYGIDTTVTDTLLDSFLSERFDNLTDGKFGEGTKGITPYPFLLRTDIMNQAHELPVEIIDFKGSNLHKADEGALEEKEETIEQLSECDGFIVLLDGDTFIQSAAKQNARGLQNLTRAHAINEVLTTALERRKARPESHLTSADEYAFGHGKTPIVFALTKGDMVAEWLNTENADKKISKTLKQLFEQRAESGVVYDPSEGPIANFIRSQFPRIMDDPDVTTLRMAVSTYDSKQGYFEPLNLEYAFQFVLFAGLINAQEEYQERMAAWGTEADSESRRARDYAAERSKQQHRLEVYRRGDIFERFIDTVFGVKGGIINAYNEANESYDRALSSEQFSSSQRQASRDHQTDIDIFRRMILSDAFVHRLSLPHEQSHLYVQGLPLDDLKEEYWWQRKAVCGKKILDQREGPVI
ncbi:MAG: hypothetical protein V4621_05245 [Pseudomonadota bacterium]